MFLIRILRVAIAGGMILGVVTPPCRALVNLNDGRDKIHVTGNVSFAWDSNIFAHQGGGGDFVMGAGLAADYARKAGLIGVDASVAVNASRFNRFTTEDFKNPSFNLEFTKQSGRTTGSLALSAARESRADTAANIRDQSWLYSAGLNLKYPVIERYSLSGGANYSYIKYQDNTALVNLKTYSANLDLFYVYTTDRDLSGGYRYRQENTSADSKNTDHAFTVGLSGKILPKLNGAINGGYQIRNSQDVVQSSSLNGVAESQYASWTSSISLTWSLSKRFTVSGQLSKDFSTTSTNDTTDTLMTSLNAVYTFSAKISASAGVDFSNNRFLGLSGGGRVDTYFSSHLGLDYSLNDHLKASLVETYGINWSTSAYADFSRNSTVLSLSSRW
jgi:hypothetical protein